MAHRVFISYHHDNDQDYKEKLIELNDEHEIFIDMSVGTDEISDELKDEEIREIIRDDYLKDSTVTILLCGTETKNRKHIDWELYSSMYNGKKNKRSGIIIVNLPSIQSESLVRASNEREKEEVFTEIKSWVSLDTRYDYEKKYPYFSERIIDNFLKSGVKISVVNWSHVQEPEKLKSLINNAFNNKDTNNYDLSTKMKRRNS